MKYDANTSTGATNSAIWMLEPIAMFSARSIWFFIATSTAVECSAALPITATTITPTNTSVSPSTCEVSSTAPTSISLIHATSAVATTSVTTARRARRAGRALVARRPRRRRDGGACAG